MYMAMICNSLLLFIIFYHVVASYLLCCYGFSNLSYRKRVKRFLINFFCIFSILFLMETILALSVHIEMTIILFILFGVDFYLIYKAYRTLYLLKYFAMALGDKSNVLVGMGLFYVVVKMRNYYILGMSGWHIKFVIIDWQRCVYKGAFRRVLCPRFIKWKAGNTYMIGKIELKLIEGEILVRDPERGFWYKFVGSFPVFILRKT